MVESLQGRFLFCSLRSFSTLLKIIGIYLSPPSEFKLKRFLCDFWSWFWVVFCLQANIWMVYKRTRMLNDFFGFIENTNIVVDLTDAIFRLGALLSATVVHIMLILIIWPTIKLFLEILESVDSDLKRPSLLHVHRISLIALISMFLKLNVNCFFNINWELYHPFRPVVLVDIIQNTISVLRYSISLISPWIYAVCGQLLVIYFSRIIFNLKSLLTHSLINHTNSKGIDSIFLVQRTLNILEPLKRLNSASDLLHRQMSNLLMINCFSAAIFILTSSYYVIDYSCKNLVMVTCWDAFKVLDNLLCFWLTCHVADRIRGATRECIPLLRQIRDDYCGIEIAFTERHKLTLYIIEIAHFQNDVNKRSLHGFFPLSKHIILKTIETLSTFLIIIFQFKDVAK